MKRAIFALGFHKDRHGIAGLAMLAAPATCGCGRLTYFVVSRDGSTRCIECDEKYTAAKQSNPQHAGEGTKP